MLRDEIRGCSPKRKPKRAFRSCQPCVVSSVFSVPSSETLLFLRQTSSTCPRPFGGGNWKCCGNGQDGQDDYRNAGGDCSAMRASLASDREVALLSSTPAPRLAWHPR